MRLKLRVVTKEYIYEEYEPNIYFYQMSHDYPMKEDLADRVKNILYVGEEE